MAGFSSLFDMLTTEKTWLINRPYDIFDEKDVTDLFAVFSQYSSNPSYSVNLSFVPLLEEHRKVYGTGSDFMKELEEKACFDPTVLVMDVIGVCKKQNIPMAAMVVVY